MKTYIGTKLIEAEEMSECTFLEKEKNQATHPDMEDRPGYKFRYKDGYESWSPKEAFEDAYRELNKMTFGDAIIILKQGGKVTRAGWNGKGMWLKLFHAGHVSDDALANSLGTSYEDTPTAVSYIAMKTADNKLIPWLASQTDVLSEDWQLIG